MGRHSTFEGLSEEQEELQKIETAQTTFRCVARLYSHFRSEAIGILPVYAKSNARGPVALAVDFVLDVEMCAKRVLGYSAYDVLYKIFEDGFGSIDPATQLVLGNEFVRCNLLEVYSAAVNIRVRGDAGEPRSHRVQWNQQTEAEDAAMDLLVEAPASELEESTEETQETPSIDYFGDSEAA